jgi:DNA-binding HxlR family transcriptional regulator
MELGSNRVHIMEQICDPVFARVDKLLALLTKSKLLHILYLLNIKGSAMRFSDIKKNVESSSTTVTRRLKELEDNGLVIRTTHSTMPVTVSYELTDDAQLLAPTIQSMYDWIVERDVQFI